VGYVHATNESVDFDSSMFYLSSNVTTVSCLVDVVQTSILASLVVVNVTIVPSRWLSVH